ncbi:hypothetical protein [Flavobacterium sp.]|uniref:hypothetical protein n=1 Tax=Flavobacterium sp. TaxID=239 RepID=UPI002B4B6D5A|nr:hypothetical protein [Flavobacterium sp.]HLF53446.1 hypothetical protein [Flavobacterium sp.]
MELDRIEILLEKYFQGETSIAEENELKDYFSSSDVAQHLEQYQSLFGYFSQAKEQKFKQEIPLQSKKRNVAWLSIAASVVVLLGIGTFTYLNYNNAEKQDLGSYDDPEVALRETQKALALLSENVNVGIESVQYVEEYETARDKVFLKF